jgi:hypothetical protein
VSDLASLIWGIVSGVIISTVVYLIVTFIPIKETARYKAIYYRRKLSKLIFDPAIKVCYTVKTQNLESKKIGLEDFVDGARKRLGQNGFSFKNEKGSTSVFNYILGTTEAEVALIPSYTHDKEGEGEPLVDYVQCDFKLTECKYRNLNGHLLDSIQMFRKLEVSLEDMVGKWIGESLTCEIKRLYEFVGVLQDLKMSSLTGKIGGQYPIELFEEKLVIYGTIETKMASMIKDIITYYF